MAEPLLAAALAAGAGLLGGAMNALAGGGTFATMPTLVALGLPSPVANATSIVALQPGAFASAWAFRAGLTPLSGVAVRTLAIVTFAGGLAGSLLLAATPTRAFDVIVPWLLLIATLALAGGPRLAGWFAGRFTVHRHAVVAVQALLGVYGGYFGGGVGMMMTAAWGLLAGRGPHEVMGHRALMLAVANGAATIVFVALGMVGWGLALPMIAGGVAGGWLGALLGRRLPAGLIRGWTILVSVATTAVFFLRAYG